MALTCKTPLLNPAASSNKANTYKLIPPLFMQGHPNKGSLFFVYIVQQKQKSNIKTNIIAYKRANKGNDK